MPEPTIALAPLPTTLAELRTFCQQLAAELLEARVEALPRPKLTLAKRPVWLVELETLADGLAEEYLTATIATPRLTLIQGGDDG
jgi:hypothetical protein